MQTHGTSVPSGDTLRPPLQHQQMSPPPCVCALDRICFLGECFRDSCSLRTSLTAGQGFQQPAAKNAHMSKTWDRISLVDAAHQLTRAGAIVELVRLTVPKAFTIPAWIVKPVMRTARKKPGTPNRRYMLHIATRCTFHDDTFKVAKVKHCKIYIGRVS